MKPITALLLFSLAGVGAACSDTVSGASEPAAEASTQSAEVQGTLNLNIGRTNDSGARPIVGSGGGAANGGLIVGPSSTGGNFADVEELGVEIQESPEALLEPTAPSDEDELIRIPEKR